MAVIRFDMVENYIQSGNAIELSAGVYATQDSNYNNRLTLLELSQYIEREYLNQY